MRLFEGEYDVAEALADLGNVWRVEQIDHKPFPSGRLTHGAIEAALTLKERHRFDAGDVAEFEVLAPQLSLYK
jgi:2-methylcitrate dehydratase PrpD